MKSPSVTSGKQSPISYTAETKPSPAPTKAKGKSVNVVDAMTKANTKKSNKERASPVKQSPKEDDSYEEDEFFDGEEETSKEVKRSNFSIDSMTNGQSSSHGQTSATKPEAKVGNFKEKSANSAESLLSMQKAKPDQKPQAATSQQNLVGVKKG